MQIIAFCLLLLFGLCLSVSLQQSSSSTTSTTPSPPSESSSESTASNATSLIEVDVTATNDTQLLPDAVTVVKAPKFNTSTNGPKKSRSEDVDILPEGYYRDVAPTVDGQPVKVGVTVTVLSIKLASDSSQVSRFGKVY